MSNFQKILIRKKCFLLYNQVLSMAIFNDILDDEIEREFWVDPIFTEKERETQSEFVLVRKLFQRRDPQRFFQYIRMSPHQFEYLLKLVAPLITKKDTNWRKAIPANKRLILTLRHLATGASQLQLAYSFRVGHSTVGNVIAETCQAIWSTLGPLVLQPPSQQRWIEISNEFKELWNCPNCIGSIDGKHIRIKAPPNSGSEFYNYKGFFSIVLLAVCDAQYCFTLVDIGDSGRHSDGGVFQNSMIGRKFEDNTLNIPAPTAIISNDPQSYVIPYFFAADDAFPLKCGIVKPYPGRFLSREKQIFNYRLSRARRVIENAFGILAARWQIFCVLMKCNPECAEVIVQACVALHNFLQKENIKLPIHNRLYCSTVDVDHMDKSGVITPGNWRYTVPSGNINWHNIGRFGSNFYSRDAGAIRDIMCEYFSSPSGAVPWQ